MYDAECNIILTIYLSQLSAVFSQFSHLPLSTQNSVQMYLFLFIFLFYFLYFSVLGLFTTRKSSTAATTAAVSKVESGTYYSLSRSSQSKIYKSTTCLQ